MSLFERGRPLAFSAGLRHMIQAAFFFSIMGLLVKLAGQRLPVSMLVMARSAVALVLCFGMLYQAGVKPWGHRKDLLLLRGVSGTLGLVCIFYALTKLPLADATVLQFLNPAITALLSAYFLKEGLKRREILGLVLSMVGVVFIARPTFLFGQSDHALDLFAVGIAVLGALFAAIAYTTIRKLSETEHHLVTILYFPLVATPATVPFVFVDAIWPTPLEWLLLVGIGVITQIAQVSLTKGLHAEKAGRAMSMSYVQIVFAALWGILFFTEIPSLLTILGAVLIVLGTFTTGRSG